MASVFSVNRCPRATLAMALLWLLSGSSAGSGAQQDPGQPAPDTTPFALTEAWLARLDLDRLRGEWLQRRLFPNDDAMDSVPESERAELAARLLDLYRQQMMQPDGPVASWQIPTRKLLNQFPELETPSVRIAIAQAQYREHERQLRQWWSAGAASPRFPPADRDADLPTLAQLRRSLADASEELNRIRTDLNEQYQRQLAELQTRLENRGPIVRALDRSESELAHASYLLGWNTYLQAVVDPVRRATELEAADQYFREFLQIDPRRILTELDAKWINFESEWQVRALAGLAMCQRGLDHPQQSDHCFSLLDQSIDAGPIRDTLPSWQLNSRLYVNDYRQLDTLIRDFEAREIRRAGRIRFWLEVWAGANAISRRASRVSGELRLAAIRGFAREFQADTLKQKLQQLRQLDPPEDEFWKLLDQPAQTFLRSWIEAYLTFAAAPSKEAELALAHAKIQQAIAAASPEEPAVDVAICRYLDGQLALAQGQLEQGSQQLMAESRVLESSGRPNLAAQAIGAAVDAQVRLARRDPQWTLTALDSIDELTSRFPASPLAAEARRIRLQLQNATRDPTDAITAWQSVPADEIAPAVAQFEIVQLRYRIWQAAWRQSDSDAIAFAVASLQTSVATLETQLPPTSDDRIGAELFLLEARLESGSLAATEVAERLDDLKRRMDTGEQSDSTRSHARTPQWNCVRVLAATADRQRKRGIEILNAWPTDPSDDADSRRWRQRACLALARSLPPAPQPEDDPPAIDPALAVAAYQQLVDSFGTSDQELQENANARIAATQQLEWTRVTEDWPQVASLAQRLRKLFPQQRVYLLEWARAQQALGFYEAAIEAWNRLALAATPGTTDWYRAKTALLECLVANEQYEQAEPLLKQTRRLSPEIPEPWNSRILAVQRRCEARSNDPAP